ncbi:hypothetical protein AUR64_04410 [Haloprofundus marisrubri]|uniref:Histidine kinase n=1 Tax=Haloprofundus marisrubri TaxID=1514971 RepID=A0A0W1RCX7_9EURY|nr:hypothetical protein [Haloprofundus marisrubri]KTG11329.1 hypothetical protein AUR64_04410 [Haloprofundus marisrubri]
MTSTTKSTANLGRGHAQALATRLRAVSAFAWIAAAVGGFIGSVPLGLMMQYGNPEPLISLALPMMYGLAGPDVLVGWAIHQFHGAALGVMYVVAVQWEPLTEYAKTLRGAAALAIVVGVVSTALLSVLLMPLWLGVVGYPFTPAFPDLTMPEKLWSVLGHIIYALPATVGYALVMRR